MWTGSDLPAATESGHCKVQQWERWCSRWFAERRLHTVLPATTLHSSPKALPLPCQRTPCALLPFSREAGFSTLLVLSSYSPLYIFFFFFFSLFIFPSSSSCSSFYLMLTPIIPSPSVHCTHTTPNRNERTFFKDRSRLQYKRHLLSVDIFLPVPQVPKGSDGFTPCCHTSPKH